MNDDEVTAACSTPLREPHAERCETCRFFLSAFDPDEYESLKQAEEEERMTAGECRRHPPQNIPHRYRSAAIHQRKFPSVCYDDWCGEWQGKGMDVTPPITDPVAIIAQLDSATIRERLDCIEREQDALKVLLRVAMRAEDPDPRRRSKQSKG